MTVFEKPGTPPPWDVVRVRGSAGTVWYRLKPGGFFWHHEISGWPWFWQEVVAQEAPLCEAEDDDPGQLQLFAPASLT